MKDILVHRTKLLDKSLKNTDLQQLEIESCKRDPLYFFRNYLRTDRNPTMYDNTYPDILPFIPFPFQEEYIKEVWESITEWNKPIQDRDPSVLTNVFIEKSRQMWISWITAGILLYWFLFHHHKYTIISRTAEEVDTAWDMDSMFEKIRFMIRELPNWMIPKWFSKELGRNKTNAYMRITDPNTGASITWKSANPDAGRWGTRNAIFMDEMAFMQNANTINKAAWNNTPCRIFNSTPNWEWNEFYRMRKLCFERVDKETWRVLLPEIKWLRYHRSEHPHYTEEWYKRKTKGMTREQIAQELEIDYNTSIIGRVYPSFPSESIDIEYDFQKPLYVWMDNSHWWQDPNSIICMQPNWAYWDIIDAIEIYQPPEYCAEYLTCQPRFQLNNVEEEFLNRYKNYNWKKAIFISDPYDTKSSLWSSTILDDYKKVWINLMLPQERKKTEQILKTRTNIHRIRYNDNCLDFASAIMNAKYPERKENSNATWSNLLPVHNRTSHYRTALEYWVTYLLENPILEKKKVIQDKRPIRNKLTWELIYR